MTSKLVSRGISDAEKLFVFNGVSVSCRGDGRKNTDFRPLQVSFSSIDGAFGSVKLCSSSYEIIAAVKGAIVQADTLLDNMPLRFSVSPAVTAAAHYSSDELESFDYISSTMESVFNQSCRQAMSCLSVVPGQSAWQLYVDILLIRSDGNLYDLCGLAAKLALWNTALPKLSVIENDFGQRDFDIPNEAELACVQLRECEDFVSALPTFVTVNLIESHVVFDCDQVEEVCSNCKFVLSYGKSLLTFASKQGDGCFGPDTFSAVICQGAECSKKLDAALFEILKQIRR